MNSEIKETFRTYNRLLGSTVNLRYEQLKAIGERQNDQLTAEYLLPLSQQASSSPRKLLIVSCSATKSPAHETLPAIKRYSGMTYCILKSLLLDHRWPSHVDLLILSAKYGLLHPLEPTPYYDQRLTPEIMKGLQSKVRNQLADLNPAAYSECFVNLSKMYSASLEDLYLRFNKQGCSIFRTDGFPLHHRNEQMVEWLM